VCNKGKNNILYCKNGKCFESESDGKEIQPVKIRTLYITLQAHTYKLDVEEVLYIKWTSDTTSNLIPPAETEWPQSPALIFLLLCT